MERKLSEEEKRIFAGELFDAHDSELMSVKHRAHEICRIYNTLDEWDSRRDVLLQNPLRISICLSWMMGRLLSEIML